MQSSMRSPVIFIAAIMLGALTWAICPWLFDTFEPFDTGVGFLAGQALTLTFTVYVGWHYNFVCVHLAVLGLYLGQNGYAYLAGSSETRAWALLLLFTSIFLCVIPWLGGLVARCTFLLRTGNKNKGNTH